MSLTLAGFRQQQSCACLRWSVGVEQPGGLLLQNDIFRYSNRSKFGASLLGEKMQINQPFRRSFTS